MIELTIVPKREEISVSRFKFLIPYLISISKQFRKCLFFVLEKLRVKGKVFLNFVSNRKQRRNFSHVSFYLLSFVFYQKQKPKILVI